MKIMNTKGTILTDYFLGYLAKLFLMHGLYSSRRNEKWASVWEDTPVTCLKAISQHYPEGTAENDIIPQLRQPVTRSRL
jgi:hypothetical protein